MNALLGRKHERELKELEVTIDSLLMAERLKYDVFRDLLSERIGLYKSVWREIDSVSYSRWKLSEKKERIIDLEQVEKLRHYLLSLNEEKGYLFDPISRGFLLDLRICCKECIQVSNGKYVQWINEKHIREPKFAHGIKLWMYKSGLRRSMVISMQHPEAGNVLYFDLKKQEEVVIEVKKTIIHDAERFGVNEESIKLIELITKLKHEENIG